MSAQPTIRREYRIVERANGNFIGQTRGIYSDGRLWYDWQDHDHRATPSTSGFTFQSFLDATRPLTRASFTCTARLKSSGSVKCRTATLRFSRIACRLSSPNTPEFMTHWQNFFHDATAEELDEYIAKYQTLEDRYTWLKDEPRWYKLAHMALPRSFLLRTRPVVVC